MDKIAHVTTHSSLMQEQRFWPHSEKYTGLNGNFLAFMGEVRKEMLFQQVKLNEKSRHFKVIGRSVKYIEIICDYRLQSKEDMDKNETLQIMREII